MYDQHTPSNPLVVVGTSQDPSSARSRFPADTKDFWGITTLPLLAAEDVTTDTWAWADPDQPAPKHWGMKRVLGAALAGMHGILLLALFPLLAQWITLDSHNGWY